ncbi:MAG: class I poly(R)-hydroxyalkanoic acid synthase [Zetaproteobacteria bacterium]|nr:MAG: class I poly(R)-hydroxyalkanoic acid synthase [Zetaproteobacteria bacterium]
MTNSSQSKKQTQDTNDAFQTPDPAALGEALINAYEKAQPIFNEYIGKLGAPGSMEQFSSINLDPMNAQESYLEFFDHLVKDPSKMMEVQTQYTQDWMNLWQDSVQKFMGQQADTRAQAAQTKGDRRFKASEWQENALFNFIKQSYLLTCQHMEKTIENADGLSKQQKHKLSFQTKLFTDAMSPTNFILTNPEVLNETMKTGGQNLIKGFENLMNDIQDGKLNIRTTDKDAFELGKNIAMTKGQVIHQNDLMQLIQYEPTTDKVHKTPLLIIPPWINKYYILDLRPGNSLIEWAIAQGHTVFVISWVNPDAKLANKQFEDYMNEGILESLTKIEDITGEAQTNAVGYCLGGTLLATTLSYLTQQKKDSRIASATFLTTLLDFEQAGDMHLFLDDTQLDTLNKMMDKHGVLDGKEMQKTFSLMRANDLIWSFVVNNYLMGREPFPFDLLYWNDDCTNMPAAMHRFYLQNMYRDNKLIEAGGIDVNDTPVDLSVIKTPRHFISAKDDHIAPWKATYEGVSLMKGENVTFTLAASGHIAGVVNPPSKNKYCHWTNGNTPKDPDEWMDKAEQHDGSWWPVWDTWVSKYGDGKVPARKVAKGIEPAPGKYVQVRR